MGTGYYFKLYVEYFTSLSHLIFITTPCNCCCSLYLQMGKLRLRKLSILSKIDPDEVEEGDFSGGIEMGPCNSLPGHTLSPSKEFLSRSVSQKYIQSLCNHHQVIRVDYELPGPLNFNESEPFKGGTESNFSCETIKMLMGFLP